MKLSDPEVRVYFALAAALVLTFFRFAAFGGFPFPIVIAALAMYWSNVVRKTNSGKGKILIVVSALVLLFTLISFILGALRLWAFLSIFG